uniref:Uncharacterized protein n=1 Tax=Kalanchoe fedtschenkoi TaxID=63787 RepID=A0A7N0TMB0_KALFE
MPKIRPLSNLNLSLERFAMCYGHRQPDEDEPRRPPPRREASAEAIGVLTLRLRLAETQARLARARAREAALSRRLEEMKRFVSVMDIIEGFLKRRTCCGC